jgi:hypothetical protein
LSASTDRPARTGRCTPEADDGAGASAFFFFTRWLGGDQTRQGRHARLQSGRFALLRAKLYDH